MQQLSPSCGSLNAFQKLTALIITIALGIVASSPAGAEDWRPVKDKWAIVAGISRFKDPAHNLRYSAKDAQDFYNFLVQQAHFAPDHIQLLLNEQASSVNVSRIFSQWLPAKVKPGDLVVVYYPGAAEFVRC